MQAAWRGRAACRSAGPLRCVGGSVTAAWAAFARRLYYAPLRATILSRLCERLPVNTLWPHNQASASRSCVSKSRVLKLALAGGLHTSYPCFCSRSGRGRDIEGQNLAIEFRWARGRYDLLPAMAAELVGRQVAVLTAAGGEPCSADHHGRRACPACFSHPASADRPPRGLRGGGALLRQPSGALLRRRS